MKITRLLLTAGWLACAVAQGGTLELEVRPVFNGEPLLLDSLRYKNTANETLSVTRLSYLLSSFAVEDNAGNWTEIPDTFAWMDAALHRDSVRLTAPIERCRGLRFTVGLDPKTNAADPAQWPARHPLNANINGLYWGWQGGYISMAAEGLWSGGGYAFHLAHDANRVVVTLATPQIDLSRDAGLLVDFDLASVLAPSLARDGTATHSREGDPVATQIAQGIGRAFRVRQLFASVPAETIPARPICLPAKFNPYNFTIPHSFPVPDLPRDNPLTEERVALGKRLFFDPALSKDGTLSCASCHQADAGMSDPRRFSVGVDGVSGSRHAMPLQNLAWKSSFFWDGRTPTLRAQALVPIEAEHEMGQPIERAVEKLGGDYDSLFDAAFGGPEKTPERIGLAVENYLLTLVACDAKIDRVMRGQATFTPSEQRGFVLFMTEYDPRTGQRGADCFHCHGGALFTDEQFHNNGLERRARDPGRYAATGRAADWGRYATPSLRNVSRRGPYMHDGCLPTLEDVVAHYDHGVQRAATLDPNLAKHPEDGLHLSADDQAALVAFLKTL